IGQNNKVVKVIGTKDSKKIEFVIDGVFVFVGLDPNTKFLEDSGVELDERKFVMSDAKLMTNVPGVFVAGDVRSGATLQIASASGEGATAALMIREYLENHEKISHTAVATLHSD